MGSWSAIVGAAGSDKARYARELARQLAERGFAVSGFVQVEVTDERGETAGWDVERVGGAGRETLARVSADDTICGYGFSDAGLAAARRWCQAPGAELVVVGGVGKLEAAERGHWPVLEGLVRDPAAPHVVACVRDVCLAAVALALPDPVAHLELPCSDEQLVEHVAALAEILGRRR